MKSRFDQPLDLSQKDIQFNVTNTVPQGVFQSHQHLQSPVGVLNLKPICIEQEPVTYRPQQIQVAQPPLMIQPEPITIPQPPIVIHPEPIIIPQAPLVFQPPAISVSRSPISVQPEAVTINRPSYSVMPQVQYDLRGCSKFGLADFKQHVHIRLTNEQIMRQLQQRQLNPASVNLGLTQGQLQQQPLQGQMQGQQLQSFQPLQPLQPLPVYAQQPSLQLLQGQQGQLGQFGQQGQASSSTTTLGSQWGATNASSDMYHPTYGTNLKSEPSYSQTASDREKASFFSRDRDYNYGNAPSTTDKLKDTLGVKNAGAEKLAVDTTTDNTRA